MTTEELINWYEQKNKLSDKLEEMIIKQLYYASKGNCEDAKKLGAEFDVLFEKYKKLLESVKEGV